MSAITDTDYELITERAGLLRRERGLIEIAGPEAAEFLQGQVTNDVEALVPGTGCYAALLTHKGRIRTDMRVLRTDDALLVDTEPIGHPIMWKTVQTYSLGRQVTSADLTAGLTVVSLIGPAARDAIEDPPPDEEHAHVLGPLGRVVTTDLGLDVICATADAEQVIAAIGLPEVSPEAAECVRIESGRPRLGIDVGGETIPQEAGLNDRAVSFTKGCYVGQETVARLHYKGRPNRHLRGLLLSEPVDPGTPVTAGEREVGSVGSVCVSPARGPIALAVLRREVEPGQEVSVGAAGVTATVCDLPFG
jgi:folate-binding protein YgfZ